MDSAWLGQTRTYNLAVKRRHLFTLALLLFSSRLLVAQGPGKDTPALPNPTGPYRVGRVSFSLTDSARTETLSEVTGSKRRFMVHVWYPADPNGVSGRSPAPYLPGFDVVLPKLSASDIKGLFRPATYIGPSSLPITSVYEGAPFVVGSQRFPLLVFSHGWGNPTFLYTAELEDIASHGYVIMAVDHPYDTAYTLFPDGTFTLFGQKSFDEAAAKPKGLNAYARDRVEVMAQDNRFAISAVLQRESGKEKYPFSGRIDTSKIGAFGHSIGGLASARTCQIDPRVLACMDQDSVDYRGSPFAVSDLQQTVTQPFFLFVVASADIWSSKMVNPTDAELVPQKLSRVEYGKLIRSEQENQDMQLASIPGGAYRLMLFNVPDYIHRSFTDQTLLAITIDHTQAVHNFTVSQRYTLSFFDKFLKGKAQATLDTGESVDPKAILEVFPVH